MKLAKRKTVKVEARLGNAEKRSLVEAMAVEALIARPDLTMVQLRRVFSYGYQTFWKRKGGKDAFEHAAAVFQTRRAFRAEMEEAFKKVKKL